jgi:hypothetical protein
VYYLKDSYDWKPGSSIPTTKIEPVIFFNRCFTGAEQHYKSLELEVVYLVWAYKRLHILLYSNNKRIIVFTDYNAIYNIVKSTNLNTTSIDRTNRRLTNASVYLSIYPLDVYYIPSRLNLVPDALSRLRVVGDDTVRADNEVEPALDTI